MLQLDRSGILTRIKSSSKPPLPPKLFHLQKHELPEQFKRLKKCTKSTTASPNSSAEQEILYRQCLPRQEIMQPPKPEKVHSLDVSRLEKLKLQGEANQVKEELQAAPKQETLKMQQSFPKPVKNTQSLSDSLAITKDGRVVGSAQLTPPTSKMTNSKLDGTCRTPKLSTTSRCPVTSKYSDSRIRPLIQNQQNFVPSFASPPHDLSLTAPHACTTNQPQPNAAGFSRRIHRLVDNSPPSDTQIVALSRSPLHFSSSKSIQKFCQEETARAETTWRHYEETTCLGRNNSDGFDALSNSQQSRFDVDDFVGQKLLSARPTEPVQQNNQLSKADSDSDLAFDEISKQFDGLTRTVNDLQIRYFSFGGLY